MYYSYKWLKKLVDFDKTPQELADDLSCKSVEIENIEKFGGDFLENVVVGEIKEINQHPNADKLRVTIVDVGDNLRLQVVCGAPNIEVGQKVPVALVGTKLHMGEIKEAKIRDVESFGMLCAEDELLLGSDHSGILILDQGLEIGTKLSEIYQDYLLDGSPASNRGDLLNHVGLAREIAAIYGRISNFQPANWRAISNGGVASPLIINSKSDSVEVRIDNLEACPLYTARLIKGVKIGPSPIWMQQSLLACGMRPINNIVDITNYVMLEYGNPLHAFDARKIAEVDGKHKIIIRLTKAKEIIRTLDGKDHEMPEGLLAICDFEKPVAIAGVMGGENSEIDESTTDLILESANFNRAFIRKSEMALGVKTEASSRFAKGLSRQLAIMALERATQLFEEICGGEAVDAPIMVGQVSDLNSQKYIEIDLDRIRKFLSIDISDEEAFEALRSLGFTVDGANVTPPSWREDIAIWQDVAEEVGRIYGLDKVLEDDFDTKIEAKTDRGFYFEQSAKKFLASIGLTEVFTMSFLSTELIEKTKMGEYYFEIENPLNEFDKIMRSGLWNGLLLHASENAKKFDKLHLFDLSKVYLPSKDEGEPSREERHLGLLVYGESPDSGLFVLKGVLDQFAQKFGLEFEYKNDSGAEFCHPSRTAQIFYKGEKVGRICEVHPLVLGNLGLKNRTWVAEVNLEALADDAQNIEEKFSEIENEVIFREFSRFEVSKRDIAIIVDEGLDTNEVAKTVKEIDNRIIGVELFDEFRSEKFGVGKKSLAFHLVFQSHDHTLTDEESDGLFNKVVEVLNNKYKAELRR